MNGGLRIALTSAMAALTVVSLAGQQQPARTQQSGGQQQPREGQQGKDGFRFHSAVDLVNVTATVADRNGRFVSGLLQDDFDVYEDGERQTVSLFSNERVPVSLGIALDTSGSMAGEKMTSARAALERFLFDLLGPDDEMFLYRFSERPDLVQSWTTDRRRLSRGLAGLVPRGGTAMYDTVAEAIPLAQSGEHQKKALVLITDGNDTNSSISVRELKRMVRESEVLVYAVGIDGQAENPFTRGGGSPPPRAPIPFPFPPFPGGTRRPPQWPGYPPPGGGGSGGGGGRSGVVWGRDDRVNVAALRELTDDSGGRTEVVRTAADLDPATESIADELSKQYYLGYASTRPRDGRWHTIEVRVHDRQYTVRARRGYMATP